MTTVSAIVNASRVQLLCITYELLQEEINALIKREDSKMHLKKALEIIKMLVEDLDMDIEIAQSLYRLYIYVQGLLIKENLKKSPEVERFQEAYNIIEKLKKAYETIGEGEEGTASVVANAEAVYAGLTYGKGEVNEVTFSKPNRGFKA